jgi:hypothetical protein
VIDSSHHAHPVLNAPKNRTGLIIGVCVAALVVVTVAAIGGVALARRASPPKAQAALALPVSTPASPTPDPTPAPLHQGDVRTFLINAPGSSAKVVPPFGTNNSFNLKQASNDWGDPKWRSTMLSLYEFQVGAIRQWKQPTLYVGDELFRFATASDALGFYNADNSNVNYFNLPDKFKPATTLPLGEIYYSTTTNKYGDMRAIGITVCGDVVVEIWVDEFHTISTELVSGLLYKQYHKLCPG